MKSPTSSVFRPFSLGVLGVALFIQMRALAPAETNPRGNSWCRRATASPAIPSTIRWSALPLTNGQPLRG